MSGTAPENQNVFAALHAAFPVDLDQVAIECADEGRQAWSWSDLAHGSARMANLLASLALAPGSRIVVQTDKSVEALVLYLATLRAGHIYVPLNPAYQAREVEYFLGDAQAGAVVCAAANERWVTDLAQASGTEHVLTLNSDGSGSLRDRSASLSDVHQVALRGTDDLAAIIYTSGTTGRSKGAMLTHGNLLSNARTLQGYWRWRTSEQGGDVLIHALPLFHVHGLFVAANGALLNGSRMIWFSRFDPEAVVARLAGATVFMGVPTMYVRLLREAGLTRVACSGMRLFVSGSAPLLIDTFNEFRDRTGHTILERYGMSETLMLTSNPCDPTDGDRCGGTVGPGLPGVEVRVRDEAGGALPAGEIGGIEVRGPNVFQGYWRLPEKTRDEFTADGWFRTGDVGRIDANGYVTIVGRSKDLIITGGYNVYPAEIEAVLNELPAVAESAVIGVPHPDFGEGVVAVVVPRSGQRIDPAALLAGLKARIANFKVPKHVQVVAQLPRNAMGKVQKAALRQQHQDLFSSPR